MLLSVLAALPGCLYTHITVPLDLNLDVSQLPPRSERQDWKTFSYLVRVDWGSDGIGDTARAHGMETVHYADLEILRVLGFWTQRWVHVYGE